MDYIQIGLQSIPAFEVPLEYEISQGGITLPGVGFFPCFVDTGVIVFEVDVLVMEEFVAEIGTGRYIGFDEKYASARL